MPFRFRTWIKKCLLLIAPPALYRTLQFRHVDTWSFTHMPAEEVELLLLQYFLTGDAVFFDVGANLGVYTYMATHYIPQKNIHVFEPQSGSCKKIRRAFPKVHIWQLALSDAILPNATLKIPVMQGVAMPTRAKLNTTFREEGETNALYIQVDVDTLDHIVEKIACNHITFMKIDVEGNEEKVIKGAWSTILKFTPILQVEIEQRHHTKPIHQIIALLEKEKYMCRYFDIHRCQFLPLPEDPAQLQHPADDKSVKYYNNFFFFPEKYVLEGHLDRIHTLIQKEISG